MEISGWWKYFYRYTSVDIYCYTSYHREGGTAKCCGQASFRREHAELRQREEQEAAEGERAEAVLQAAVGHQQEPRPGTVCSSLDINILLHRYRYFIILIYTQ